MLSEVFAAAARPSKGGFVRDALTSSYPRLVTLLESTVNRIITDSRIKVCDAASHLRMPCVCVFCWQAEGNDRTAESEEKGCWTVLLRSSLTDFAAAFAAALPLVHCFLPLL